eukprot:scaffold2682_cov90-Skeletonema_marinoi.AAC.3
MSSPHSDLPQEAHFSSASSALLIINAAIIYRHGQQDQLMEKIMRIGQTRRVPTDIKIDEFKYSMMLRDSTG